jgi:hypothetical protein
MFRYNQGLYAESTRGYDDVGFFLAIAWQYPGQTLEVIPASYSRMTRPDLSLP